MFLLSRLPHPFVHSNMRCAGFVNSTIHGIGMDLPSVGVEKLAIENEIAHPTLTLFPNVLTERTAVDRSVPNNNNNKNMVEHSSFWFSLGSQNASVKSADAHEQQNVYLVKLNRYKYLRMPVCSVQRSPETRN